MKLKHQKTYPAFKNYLAGQNLVFDQAESDRQADIRNQQANQRIDQIFERGQQADANRANAEYQERIRSRQLNKYHEQDTEKLYFRENENTTVKPLQENRTEFGAMQVNKANKLKIAFFSSSCRVLRSDESVSGSRIAMAKRSISLFSSICFS